MRVALERVGVAAVQHKAGEDWRQWAYEQTLGAEPMRCPVRLVVTPFCTDTRGRAAAGTQWPIVEMILDGFIASGLLPSRKPGVVWEVAMRTSKVEGRDGLRLELSDADEPF